MMAIALLVVAGVLAWPRSGARWPVRAFVRLPEAGDQLRGQKAASSPWPAMVWAALKHRAGVKRRESDCAWVADLAESTAVGLRAGLDLRSALLVAARSPTVAAAHPLLASDLSERLQTGSTCWAALDASTAHAPPVVRADLGVLVAACRLTEDEGARAADTAAAAAAATRGRRASMERIAAALAGPQSSMRLLTALPLVGPVAALAVGLSPVSVYSSAVGLSGAVVGVVLTSLGWLWSRRIVRHAVRPATMSPGRR